MCDTDFLVSDADNNPLYAAEAKTNPRSGSAVPVASRQGIQKLKPKKMQQEKKTKMNKSLKITLFVIGGAGGRRNGWIVCRTGYSCRHR